MTGMTRREAIGAMGALGASTMAMGGLGRLGLSRERLGWNEAAGEYTLPPLPYAYNALEPHIDEQTMRIHHDKHHAGYVKGLNEALEKLASLRAQKSDAGLLQHWERKLSFNGGGHINHTLFWQGMAPADQGGGGSPQGALREQIDRDFGSYDNFEWQFRSAAGGVEGSGWGWLAWETLGQRLVVLQMENQQKLLFPGLVPLLGVDVWEHAYYLKYQNRRGDYVDAFLNVVNWGEIARRFKAATGA
ncbi:MAG: superoxide dismutase [Phycisphaerales bacterium]